MLGRVEELEGAFQILAELVKISNVVRDRIHALMDRYARACVRIRLVTLSLPVASKQEFSSERLGLLSRIAKGTQA